VNPPTTLVLVRHGESQAMVDQIVGGAKGCRGLSVLGRRQAAALRDRLARTGELRPDAVYASTLPRAIETAAIVAPALGHPEVVTDADLCELVPGECDGLAWADAAVRYEIGAERDPDRALSPGGETPRQFQARVEAVIGRLLDRHAGRTILAVCHGGVIVACSRHLMGVPGVGSETTLWLDPGVTSMTEWHLADGRHILRRYNDAAHLLGTF
jgi:probable phosphoglycerate mutase